MGQYFTNENLPSKIQKTECFVLGCKFIFLTDNGVFSKDGLDLIWVAVMEYLELL